MAQDKIYFDNHTAKYNSDKRNEDDTEYVRKDALLEWAKEQAVIAEKLNGRGAMLKAWDSLIDKIESL